MFKNIFPLLAAQAMLADSIDYVKGSNHAERFKSTLKPKDRKKRYIRNKIKSLSRRINRK